MAIVLDMEWIEISSKVVSLTQLSALRISESLEVRNRFDTLIRPKNMPRRGWRHIAFNGHDSWEYQNGETERDAVVRFFNWLRPGEEIYLWDENAARAIKTVYHRYNLHALTYKCIFLSQIIASYTALDGFEPKSIYNTASDYSIPDQPVRNCSCDDVNTLLAILKRLNVDLRQSVEMMPDGPKSVQDQKDKSGLKKPAEELLKKSEPMVFCSLGSHRKIVHYSNCTFLAQIPKTRKFQFDSIDVARQMGYRLCNCCPAIAHRYRSEKSEIDSYIKGRKLKIVLNDGYLYVTSRFDEWVIFITGKNKALVLYHKNRDDRYSTFDIPSIVPGYHSQAYRADSIVGYLKYIQSHDEFRTKSLLKPNPVSNQAKKVKKQRFDESTNHAGFQKIRSKKKHKKSTKREKQHRLEREMYQMQTLIREMNELDMD